jgi:hypothetical protein
MLGSTSPEDLAMKVVLTTAAFALSTVSMLAQAGESGVSRPDSTPITVETEGAAQPQATKASALPPSKPTAYVPYVPYTAPAPVSHPDSAVNATRAAQPFNPDAEIVTTNAPGHQEEDSIYKPYRPYGSTAPTAPLDIDAGIVTDVPMKSGEMPEGTLLKVRMNNSLSTKDTVRGSAFSATVSNDVQRDGHVIIPAGSILDGMVTEVRGGRRISGRAAIHLEPRRVTLPDGTYYVLHAQVIDTSEENNVRVDREGTIVRRDHAKETIAIMTATTGSAAVAGALIGGGVGAAVGAGIGAGAGTILWLKQDRQTALPKDTSLVFSLTTPMMMKPLQDGAQLRP